MFILIIMSFFFSLPSSFLQLIPPPRTTVTKLYYLIRGSTQIIEFGGEIEGLAGSSVSFEMFNYVQLSGGMESQIGGENFSVVQNTGTCDTESTMITCTSSPGGLLDSVGARADARPVTSDPMITIFFRNIDWDDRPSDLRVKYDMGGCVDDLDREPSDDVSGSQTCTRNRATVDFSSSYGFTRSGSTSAAALTFSEGSDSEELLVTLGGSSGTDSLQYSFDFTMLVPEEFDGNVGSDDSDFIDDSDNTNDDDDDTNSGTDDDSDGVRDDDDSDNNNDDSDNNNDDSDNNNDDSDNNNDDSDNNNDDDDDERGDSESASSSVRAGASLLCSLLFSLIFFIPH